MLAVTNISSPIDFRRFKPSHHLTHRFFLLKLHSLLFISPHSPQTESLQAARIWARNSAVPASFRDDSGEHSPSFDLWFLPNFLYFHCASLRLYFAIFGAPQRRRRLHLWAPSALSRRRRGRGTHPPLRTPSATSRAAKTSRAATSPTTAASASSTPSVTLNLNVLPLPVVPSRCVKVWIQFRLYQRQILRTSYVIWF
jgi:hypothetical protein